MELQLDLNKEYGLSWRAEGAKGRTRWEPGRPSKEAGRRGRDLGGSPTNGALVCMDDFAKAERIGRTATPRVMDVDDTLMDKIKNFQLKNLPDFLAGGTALRSAGLSIAPLKGLIDELVDEERIRSSGA